MTTINMATTSAVTTTNVVRFPQRPQANGQHWRQDELQALVALFSAQAAHGEADSWDVGVTEAGDPQFYLMGPAPGYDCVLSISRIGRLYLLEDACGTVLAEDDRLKAVTEVAMRRLSRRRNAFVVRILLTLCAFRMMIEQKIEPFLAESTENLTRFAPELAALI